MPLRAVEVTGETKQTVLIDNLNVIRVRDDLNALLEYNDIKLKFKCFLHLCRSPSWLHDAYVLKLMLI